MNTAASSDPGIQNVRVTEDEIIALWWTGGSLVSPCLVLAAVRGNPGTTHELSDHREWPRSTLA